VYKGDRIEWRRLRLLAQLKAATEQLDNLITGFDSVAELIVEESWPEVISKRKVERTMRERFECGDIPLDCQPASWVRFSDNVYSLIRGATGKRPDDTTVNRAIASIQKAVDNNRGDAFPRSISLVQFVLGALTLDGIVAESLGGYCPMVTEQLKTTFPAVTRLKEQFDFQLYGV
jgi:hypothetical protein